MELVKEEYINRGYTPTPAQEGLGVGDWVGFMVQTWQWFNYGASRLMFAMVVLVSIAVLDQAHNNMFVSLFLSLVLLSMVAGELVKIYKGARDLIIEAGLPSHLPTTSGAKQSQGMGNQ